MVLNSLKNKNVTDHFFQSIDTERFPMSNKTTKFKVTIKGWYSP